jgi:16S rRNA (guanine527-N7)-methyltransferase
MKKKPDRRRGPNDAKSADARPRARHPGRNDASRIEPPSPREPIPFKTDAPPLAPPPSFLAAAGDLGVTFDDGDLDRLGRYLAMLLEANALVNLTAIREPDEAWHRHILDALTLLPVLADLEPREAEKPADAGAGDARQIRLIDVGTGGGVPGIPLAIVAPQIHVTLLEATGKKAEFLRAATQALGLGNTTVTQDRAESLGQDRAHRETYDVAVARAVGRLAMVAELIVPLVRRGGLALAIKGEQAERELEEAAFALGKLGARFAGLAQTPTGRVIVLEKTTLTPRTYPRKPGEPKRAPLGL